MTSKENMRKNNRTYYQRHKEEILKRRKSKREDYKNQLAQAKKIIKGLLSCCRNYPQENAEKMEQAEQFLKGENIILEDAQAENSPFNADEVFNKEMKAYPDEN